MKTIALIAAFITALSISAAAPAIAQDTPDGGPPQHGYGPPTDMPPSEADSTEEPAPAEAAPEEPMPAETAPAEPEAAAPVPAAAPPRHPARPTMPAKKRKRCSKRQAKARYRKCLRAQRRAAKRPLARKSNVFGQFGFAVCRYTADNNAQFMYHAPPSVGSNTRQWIQHWNGYSEFVNGEQGQPRDWIGPFWSHTDHPGWFKFGNDWYRDSQLGSWSQHGMPSGLRVTGVQWINWHSTGEIAYAYTQTSDCGYGGYFGQG